jgi:hypothetical protein
MCGGPLWAHLGPILGYPGPSLACFGGPGWYLEVDVGLGRLDFGMQGNAELSNASKNH